MTEATKKKIIRWFWILFTVPVVLVISLIALVWALADIPSFEELENPDSKLATQVISSDGEILTTFHIENRSFISYEELSDSFVLHCDGGLEFHLPACSHCNYVVSTSL